jgi:anti-sigma regulatory factor (Ser/Thr protein kinase)
MNTLADCAIARHGAEAASASITVQPIPAAPRQARTFTRQSPYRWGEDEQLSEAAVLVVCEPVTNTVRHGAQPPPPGRPCERIWPSLVPVILTLHPGALHAGVRDGSGILPIQRSAGREDGCGRGLAITGALAGHSTSDRAPGGGNRVRACRSPGNGLFDGGR